MGSKCERKSEIVMNIELKFEFRIKIWIKSFDDRTLRSKNHFIKK